MKHSNSQCMCPACKNCQVPPKEGILCGYCIYCPPLDASVSEGIAERDKVNSEEKKQLDTEIFAKKEELQKLKEECIALATWENQALEKLGGKVKNLDRLRADLQVQIDAQTEKFEKLKTETASMQESCTASRLALDKVHNELSEAKILNGKYL